MLDIGATAGAAGLGLVNNVMDVAFGKVKQNQQLEGQKKALEQQNAAQMDMWQRTNYGPQMEQLKKAGLNPALMYGMSGGGGSTTGSGSAMPTAQGAAHGMDIAGAAQVKLLNEQAKGLELDNKIKEKELEGKGYDVDTKRIDNIIKEYGFQDEWQEVITGSDDEYVTYGENPQRKARREALRADYEARKTESGARQKTSENIIEQWKNGNMAKMSQSELDNKLAELGVKQGTIKKIELENALTEMEKAMLENFDLGRDAKGWLGMAGNALGSIIKLLIMKNRK